jgi:hypothetical protein
MLENLALEKENPFSWQQILQAVLELSQNITF